MDPNHKELIAKIRQTRPMPNDPEKLTGEVMERIAETSQVKEIPLWVKFIRPVMTAAAIGLIALLIVQNLRFQEGSVTAETHDISIVAENVMPNSAKPVPGLYPKNISECRQLQHASANVSNKQYLKCMYQTYLEKKRRNYKAFRQILTSRFQNFSD